MNTLQYFISVFAFVAVSATLPPTIYAQETVAMVTAVDGEARVEAGGVTKALEIGAELPEGAVVSVTAGGASLVFMSGDLMELTPGDILTLGADMTSSALSGSGGTRGVSSEDGVTVAEEGIGKANTGQWQSQLAYIYGVRGDASVVPIAPRLAIASPTPVFYWFDGDSAMQGSTRQYTIALKNDAGETILKTDVEGTVYAMNSFPAPPLPAQYAVQPGKRYTWTVAEKGKAPQGGEASYIYIDEAGLQLAEAKQQRLAGMRERGEIGEQTYHTLMAMFYLDERERLFSDAVGHLLALEETPAGASYARTQLALLLNRFGNEVSTVAAWYARKAR